MRPRHVVAFTIPALGHVNRMLPLIAGLCERGISVDFFADAFARGRIEQTGARFVDIYAGHDKDDPDDQSYPLLIRNVSFAGHWGEAIAREIAPLQPSLVVHDTFAVIGRVVAAELGLPRVNMQAWHNLQPSRVQAELEASGELHVSEACLRSVRRLRERHGIEDASPFSYFVDGRADLTVYAEPPEFLPVDQRGPFEPMEFFGSYWPADGERPRGSADPFGPGADGCLKVFVGLGTGAWIVCPDHTRQLLEALADAFSTYPNLRAIISLGSERLAPPGFAERIRREHVAVAPFVDQIDALRHASVFVTHNGLNSTHEAIMHRVPMLSHPLFDDQPVLSARCRELGLALPLVEGFRRVPTTTEVHRALDRLQAEMPQLRTRLAEAEGWEQAVMADRPRVLDRVIGLMRP